MLAFSGGSLSIAPPACLALEAYQQIRETAPFGSRLASDEFSTVLSAGGVRSFDVPWHSHDCLMILLPRRGAINFRDETRRSGTWISEERFISVPKGLGHAGESDYAPHIVLYLTDTLIARIDAQYGPFKRLKQKVLASCSYAVTPEIRTLRELCLMSDVRNRAEEAARNHLVAALLLRLLVEIDCSPPLTSGGNRCHADGVVGNICSFVETHVMEDISLDAIAETFGFSRRHTTRLFRRCTGLSIAEYHEKMRIRLARRLLSETTLPVSEVALRVGFESGSALARATKRLLSRSPTALRGLPSRTDDPTWRNEDWTNEDGSDD